MRAAHVLSEATGGDLLARLRMHRASSMVGRDRERAALRERWHSVRQGEGRMVLLSGDPGIGKSRLIADLVADIQHEAASVMAVFGRPDGTDSPFRPLEEPLRAAMSIAEDADPEDIRARAAAFATSIGLASDTAGMAFAVMLGVAQAEMPPAAGLRRLIFEALLGWIGKLAADGPTVLIAEDIHWADASTLDFLRQLAERIETMRVLLVATHRSDFTASWPPRPQTLQVALGPLVGSAATRLAEDVAGDLPQQLRQTILDRAEGVPLFIEEFARSVDAQDVTVGSPAGIAVAAAHGAAGQRRSGAHLGADRRGGRARRQSAHARRAVRSRSRRVRRHRRGAGAQRCDDARRHRRGCGAVVPPCPAGRRGLSGAAKRAPARPASARGRCARQGSDGAAGDAGPAPGGRGQSSAGKHTVPRRGGECVAVRRPGRSRQPRTTRAGTRRDSCP